MFMPCRRLARRGWASSALPQLLALTIGLVVLSFSPRAHAYTWMIKHGYSNCGACHSDPSGGELLTVYGRAMSEAFLSSKFGGDSESSAETWERRQMARFGKAASAKLAKPDADEEEEEADEEEEAEEPADDAKKPAAKADGEEDAGDSEEEEGEESSDASEAAAPASETEEPASERSFSDPFFGLFGLPESILLGGSIRLATIYNGDAETKIRPFPMQLDLYGELRVSENFRGQASIGVSKVKAGSPHGRAAQITTNQGDGYRLISRTHWLAFDFGGGNHTIRAGRMNLPYGLRIPEHTMWVRERTETDRESDQQHGLSLAMNFEKVRFELMGIAGNYQSSPDEFRERGYSGYLEMMIGDRAAFGLSSLVTHAKNDRLSPSDESLHDAPGARHLLPHGHRRNAGRTRRGGPGDALAQRARLHGLPAAGLRVRAGPPPARYGRGREHQLPLESPHAHRWRVRGTRADPGHGRAADGILGGCPVVLRAALRLPRRRHVPSGGTHANPGAATCLPVRHACDR